MIPLLILVFLSSPNQTSNIMLMVGIVTKESYEIVQTSPRNSHQSSFCRITERAKSSVDNLADDPGLVLLGGTSVHPPQNAGEEGVRPDAFLSAAIVRDLGGDSVMGSPPGESHRHQMAR